MPAKIEIKNITDLKKLLKRRTNNINFESDIIEKKLREFLPTVVGLRSSKIVNMFNKSFSIKGVCHGYYLERGWTESEAKEKSDKHKNTKENFIRRYGKSVGEEKWKIFLNKSLITKENFISRHGDKLGGKKWEELSITRKRQHTLERYRELYGDNAEEKLEEIKEKKKPSLKNWIRLYGDVKGKEKWDNFCKNNSFQNTLSGFKERYGEFEGEQRYLKVCDSKKQSKTNFIMRYGEVEGEIRYKKMIEKRAEMGQWDNASKESLKILLPLFKKIKKIFDISKNDIFIGTKNSKEYFIASDGTIRFYDFAIPSLNIIVEYHGSAWHPNKEKLSVEEWNSWVMPFSNITADEKHSDDQYKRRLAENRGFKYFEIWDFENKDDVIQRIVDKLT